jgi:hypothetical protein
MNISVVLTVVIRRPAYLFLVAELVAIANPRGRAGLLKRLAEDGARAACGEPPISPVRSSHVISQLGDEPSHLDIRVVICAEEFPRLHAVLTKEGNPRTRASMLRRLAAEALCRRPSECLLPSPREESQRTTTRSAGTEEFSLESLVLPPDALPPDLLAGFGANQIDR